jgi:hypothetical protein
VKATTGLAEAGQIGGKPQDDASGVFALRDLMGYQYKTLR